MADGEAHSKKSDLGVRTISAIVMLAVAGTALWLGGWWWTIFVLLVAGGVWFEWSTLVLLFKPPGVGRTLWRASGAIYCGVAAAMLMTLRDGMGVSGVFAIAGAVIGTDVGAYFAGRTIGGPKIAPKISPSKTWAGLFGGMLGASLILAGWHWAWASGLCDVFDGLTAKPLPEGVVRLDGPCAFVGIPPVSYFLLQSAMIGSLIAIIAQSGDFFESWMKRRAGVKDSGKLIPGHGGLFDRVDGLLAICFVMGLLYLAVTATGWM